LELEEEKVEEEKVQREKVQREIVQVVVQVVVVEGVRKDSEQCRRSHSSRARRGLQGYSV
jgi:hypothetical protein